MIKYTALLILIVSHAMSRGSAGSTAKFEPRYLIDIPTAGMIPHRNLALDMDLYQNGGLLTGISIGIFDRLIFGISYGGDSIIGNGKPNWNATPGFQIRLRIINETIILPAIALGFDSQGKDFYDEDFSRYSIKSPGLYAVASKNYRLLGNLSLHGGMNYSFERADGDRDPNVFLGCEKSLGQNLSIFAEYNVGWNDSHRHAFGKGRGYLNVGSRLAFGAGFSLGLNFKDILKNQKEMGNRTMMLEYIQFL